MSKYSTFILTTTLILSMFILSAHTRGFAEQENNLIAVESNKHQRDLQFNAVRTDSPRQTFETLIYLINRLDNLVANYGVDSASDDIEAYSEILLIFDQANALIAHSGQKNTHNSKVNHSAVAHLVDIFARVELPTSASIPDLDDDSVESWRVPGTPLRIVKILEGPRMGEFLFDENTHWDAKRFYRGIAHFPLRTSANIESWTQTFPQITGPMIPARIINSIPPSLKELWVGTPIWKILLTLGLTTAVVVLAVSQYRLLNKGIESYSVKGAVRSVIGALGVLLLFYWLRLFVDFQLNLAGDFLVLMHTMFTVVTYLAFAWLFWWGVQGAFLQMVRLRAFTSEEIEYPLILVVGKVLAFLGVIVIITSGIQALGLPLFSLVASLGVGGIAVALSIRPTLENMIGGVILYLDKPVRIGDFCTFGDKTGTVEHIGIRTIKIRAIDRTLISIPNAAFADMELINWAHCDKMMIRSTIPLRFNTDPDQLRYLLVKMREMCHAHPKIDSETIRIRLVGFGDSSMDVELRVYTLTHEWNEFFSIREDIFLRIKDLISDSGVSFAIPMQTLQMAPNETLDENKAKVASDTVKSWRKTRKLPFPGLSANRMNELKGTLDWPPKGSFDSVETLEAQEPIEPLSTTNSANKDVNSEEDESKKQEKEKTT